MQKPRIIEVVPDVLYSIQLPGDHLDAYRQWVEDHQDIERMMHHFKQPRNLKNLHGGYFSRGRGANFSPGDAALTTMDLVDQIEKRLLEAATTGLADSSDEVLRDFEFLHPREDGRRYPFTELKLKAGRHPNWLRLYGVQFADRAVVITGGGIKLTRRMQEDPVLERQLARMTKTIAFLDDIFGPT